MGAKGNIQCNKIYLQLINNTNIKNDAIISHLQHKIQDLLFLEHLTAVFQVFSQELGNTSERLNGCFI